MYCDFLIGKLNFAVNKEVKFKIKPSILSKIG